MLKWLFGSSDKPTTGSCGLDLSNKNTAKVVIPAAPRRILSVAKAKANDELITIGTGDFDGVVEQYIRRSFGAWFHYPSLEKLDELFRPYEALLESYHLKQDYATESPLEVAIKARKSVVKCIYCHTELQHKAQVCLHCGGFMCLECAPTQPKCPTLGCQQ
jgi:hypothetical protein